MKAARKRFDPYYGHLLSIENKVVLQFDNVYEPADFTDHMVLLRSLFVWHDHRGKRLALRGIRESTRISDQTGCCILSITSPFL